MLGNGILGVVDREIHDILNEMQLVCYVQYYQSRQSITVNIQDFQVLCIYNSTCLYVYMCTFFFILKITKFIVGLTFSEPKSTKRLQ